MPSATLASLQTDLQSIIKRPDLFDDSALHIKNALLKAHTKDYWLKDIYETNFQFGTAAINYTLEPKTLIPLYRSMKYLTIIDPITEDVVRELKPLPVESWLDSYGYIKDYVWYVAGTNVQIRCSGQETIFGLGVYLYPDTTLATPSWIADEFPFVILYEAARTMFRLIGFDEQAASAERLVKEAMDDLVKTAITSKGE